MSQPVEQPEASEDSSSELGSAIVVNGEVVAWFKYPDEEARDWCSYNHHGKWLAWRAKPPELVPLTEEETARINQKASEMHKAFMSLIGESHVLNAEPPAPVRGEVPQANAVASNRPAIPIHPPAQKLTMTARQLRVVLDLVNPDGAEDADQMDCEVTIAHLEEQKDEEGNIAPGGLYAWLTDYPDEGSVPLFGQTGDVE